VTSNDLQGSLAVITGGASGIGYSLAKAYGHRGASVLLVDRDETALQTALVSLKEDGIDAHGDAVDLCDPAAVDAAAERAESLGPIGAVCLNAGVSGGGLNVWETPQAAFDFAFGVNVWALVNSIRSFVPLLIAQDRPADLVVTTSLAGLVSLAASSPYTASKAAAIALTRSLRAELASAAPKVQVACLAPAMVKTNLQRTTAAHQPEDIRMDAKHIEETEAAFETLGASPDDVARWVLDALDDGRFWVLSQAGDPFVQQLAGELEELSQAIGAFGTGQ
jgi:NAD(P)-dependent dehydrogenase (short-subunit alcohol dehydrogenase family)